VRLKEISMSEHTRREFFKKGGQAALGGVVVAASLPTLARGAPKAPDEWDQHWGMLVDLRRCIGCQGCTVACKAENGVSLGLFRRRVRTVMTGSYPDVKRHFVPISCFHCEKPACMEACEKLDCYVGQKKSAISQTEDGYVVIDKDVCQPDNKPCLTGCPYHNIFYDPDADKADKCTFCDHRVKQGLIPACVQTCEGGALQFGDLKDPNSEIAKTIAANETKVLRPKKETRPSFHYIGLEPEVQRVVEGMVSKGKRLRPRELENDR
jgi:tetrathionate reductase subunit B